MAKKSPSTAKTDAIVRELRAFGLTYPEAHTKSPWPGHLDLAVRDKTFAYLSVEGEPLRVSCKLPASSAMALHLPFAEPTGYGLGKSGWVSASFAATDDVPVELLKAWIDESYRAQAPKRLVATLPPADGAEPAAVKPAKKKAGARRSPAKSTVKSASTRRSSKSAKAV